MGPFTAHLAVNLQPLVEWLCSVWQKKTNNNNQISTQKATLNMAASHMILSYGRTQSSFPNCISCFGPQNEFYRSQSCWLTSLHSDWSSKILVWISQPVWHILFWKLNPRCRISRGFWWCLQIWARGLIKTILGAKTGGPEGRDSTTVQNETAPTCQLLMNFTF